MHSRLTQVGENQVRLHCYNLYIPGLKEYWEKLSGRLETGNAK